MITAFGSETDLKRLGNVVMNFVTAEIKVVVCFVWVCFEVGS
jgi:hypothetical protein